MADSAASLRPSKRLGQNFLRDSEVASKIVSTAGLGREDTVLEPGAGYGILTKLLDEKAGQVIAVEKDKRLAIYLKETFRNNPSVTVIEGDVLKVPLPTFNKIVGTPPYNLSSKLILFLSGLKFEHASLVFQREFGERLLAGPGTREYGRLSVTSQRMLEMKTIMRIPRTAFQPRPRVDSILLTFSPKTPRLDVDRKTFEDMVRGIFTQRRRLLKGALGHFLRLSMGRERAARILGKMVLPEARVYQLSVEQLEGICQQLSEALDENHLKESNC